VATTWEKAANLCRTAHPRFTAEEYGPLRGVSREEFAMSGTSRRGFLAAAGTGVATVAVAPAALAATAAGAAPNHEGAVVAYVKDAATGQVSVMAGDREVVVTDKNLVRSITRHLRG
jgi:hypothetical protein